jgi:hypothetical protein
MQPFPQGASAGWHLAALGIKSSPQRVGYLTITLAVTVAAWLVLAALASPFIDTTANATSDSGITVRNARSSQQMLPIRYAQRITAISGVRDIVYRDLKLVSCPDGSTVTINAIGGSGADRVARANGYSVESVVRWQDDPLGLLVSAAAADNCGWKTGAGISPPDEIKQSALPMHISGVAVKVAKQGDTSALAHYPYINRDSYVAGENNAISFSVSAKDPNQQETLAARIESEFTHDDPPVAAYPDTLSENARARFGKVQYLIVLVIGALLLCCALTLSSIMAHAAAERRPHFALLRVLGFGRRTLLLGFFMETLAIMLAGVALGALLGWSARNFIADQLRDMFGFLDLAPWAWRLMPLWLCALLVVSLVPPCLIAWRTRTTDFQK